MSKAFTKDDDSDAPLVLRPRAPLPAGVPNYVTARGLTLLREELARLEAERAEMPSAGDDEAEWRRRREILGARLAELAARLAGATLVETRAQPHDEVRFGATVTVRTLEGPRAGEERRFRIVGVDEADAAHGRIAFTAPIARALIGLGIGENATLETARGEEQLRVTGIDYESD